MEKESVKKFDLEAAFKALDEIEIPVVEGGVKANKVNLRERFNAKSAHEVLVEDYYDVSSNEDLEEAQEEREGEVAQAKLARIEKIVDLDAETADDLLPSYVGKVIMQCPQCMTLFYKNPEDIEHSEENPDVVNINEVCQHCGNTSGYTLIGKVDAVSEDEADKYEAAETGEEAPAEEDELDLDFEEPTEEVDAEGTGEAELSDDELAELDLDLAEIPEEEPEEKNESLNTSEAQKDAEEGSDLDTEHKSENLTLNEEVEWQVWYGGKDGLHKEFKDEEEAKKFAAENNGELMPLRIANESLNNSEEQKAAEKGSELKTENSSENLTLNEEVITEEVDKDLDKKLKLHNDYIEYLKNLINQDEEALKNCDNDEVKAAIQRHLEILNADLEAALPDALKAEDTPVEEVETEEVVEEEKPANEAWEVVKPKVDSQSAMVNYVATALNSKLGNKVNDGAKIGWSNEHGGVIVMFDKNAVNTEELKKVAIKGLTDNGFNPTKIEIIDGTNNKNTAALILTNISQLQAQAAESLTEEEKPAEEAKEENGNEIDYVDYKHSYCHVLAPKLRALNYLINVKKADVGVVKGYIKKLLKDPEVKWTDKEKEFLKNIEEKEDARDIYNYVKNSIEKAKTINVKVDDNGELVEDLNEGFEGCLYEILTESLNNSEAQKDAENKSELKTENESENLTLNEAIDPEIEAIINSWSIDDVQEDLGLEECNKAVLKEDDEEPVEEDKPEDKPEENTEEDKPEVDLAAVEFNGEEVKELATEIVSEVIGPDENKTEEEQKEEIDAAVEAKVEVATEEKLEAAEAPVEEVAKEEVVEETPVEENLEECNKQPVEEAASSDAGLDKLLDSEEFQTPISDAEVEGYINDAKNESLTEDIDELDEASLNAHITDYLKEVYSNVDSFEATDCSLNESLVIEGKIKFNSGKEKLTVFEFLPAYEEGKLFFEGINKEFAEDKAFRLNCSINESKTLITESFGYKYNINETLVEGLK